MIQMDQRDSATNATWIPVREPFSPKVAQLLCFMSQGFTILVATGVPIDIPRKPILVPGDLQVKY